MPKRPPTVEAVKVKDRLTRTKQGMRLYQQERLILEVTELVCELLDLVSINKTTLARRLCWSKQQLDEFLDGRADVTLRTVSDVFVALNSCVHISYDPLEDDG